MYRFRKAQKKSSKVDDNPITFQLRNGKSIDLLPKVTALRGFKVWTQHRSKRKPLNQTNDHLVIDYTYKS